MASRVVEILYSLKDFFTPGAKKVVKGYDQIGDASDQTARRVERNQKRTQSAIERAGQSVSRLRGIWLGLSAALGAFQGARAFGNFVDDIDRLGKVSKRLGVTVDNLAALSFAAEQAGVSSQQFEVAIQRLIRRTGDAAAGIGESAKAFARFGIDAQAFSELDLEQKLQQLAIAFNSIGSEEEALAALQKLVDSEGLGLSVLLQQGPDGIAQLAKQFKDLNPELEKAAEEAAAFNDAANLFRKAREGLFRKAETALLTETNQLLGTFNLLGNEIENVKRQIEDARRAQRGFVIAGRNINPEATAKYAAEVERLEKVLAELEGKQKANTEGAKKLETQLKENQKTTAEYQKDVKELSKAYDEQTDARKKALREETAELRKARREQQSIEKEFADLVKDVTAVEDQDVSLGDVFARINQGAAAVERGELGKAVELSREGADLLGKLKEEGTETTGTLKFLAEELKKVATQAAAADVAAEETDVAKAQQAFDNIKAQAEILKQTAPEAGTDYARAFLAAMTEEFQRTVIPAPQVAAPGGGGSNIRRTAEGWTDGTDFRARQVK